MKKYIIVSYIDGEITKPDLYSNEKEAYAVYARTLLNDINEITYDADDEISDEEYNKISDIIDNEDVSVIKNTVENMMKKYTKNYNIYRTSNGYEFENSNYILEIFEVEEK